MLITNHVLAGALIGTAVRRPGAAFVVGVASHFAMDVVPHWGEERIFLRVAVVDGLVGAAVMATVAATAPPGRRASVVAGMVGACLPDTDKPSEMFFGRSPFPPALDAWHKRIQRESPRRLLQEPVVAAASALLLRRVWRGRAAEGVRARGRGRGRGGQPRSSGARDRPTGGPGDQRWVRSAGGW
ncbi:MAG: hypothetical protein Q7T56_17620 [Nocardioidaceae bacterium]|nr:hypothetical protein [Nocardioidaceae bacterium]